MRVLVFLSAYPPLKFLVGVRIRLLFTQIIILVGFTMIFEERASITNKSPLITSGLYVSSGELIGESVRVFVWLNECACK